MNRRVLMYAVTVATTVLTSQAYAGKRGELDSYNKACREVSLSTSSTANCFYIVREMRQRLSHFQQYRVYENLPEYCQTAGRNGRVRRLSVEVAAKCSAIEAELIYITLHTKSLSNCERISAMAHSPGSRPPPSFTVCRIAKSLRVRTFRYASAIAANAIIAESFDHRPRFREEIRDRSIVSNTGTY